MVSTVSQRPNHYETLGVKPSATAEEIDRAFAREALRPRVLGGLAPVGVAYETLRDPARRKAYDRAIGLSPPDPAPGQWAFAAAHWSATARVDFARLVAPVTPAPAQPAPEPAAEQDAPDAPFIAAARAESAEPLSAAPAGPRSPREPHLPAISGEPLFSAAETGTFAWKRIGILAGLPVLAVVLFGAWAGWESSNDMVAEPSDQSSSLSLPLPAPARASAPGVPAPAPSPDGIAAEPQGRPAVAARPAAERTLGPERAPPAPVKLTAAEEQELAASPFVDSISQQLQTAGDSTDVAAADAPAIKPAAMPLGDRVIARTIQRIGYACGQVASTTAVEGAAPGVFTVTCTSGHSYRAQPVRGRYRFKRLGSR